MGRRPKHRNNFLAFVPHGKGSILHPSLRQALGGVTVRRRSAAQGCATAHPDAVRRGGSRDDQLDGWAPHCRGEGHRCGADSKWCSRKIYLRGPNRPANYPDCGNVTYRNVIFSVRRIFWSWVFLYTERDVVHFCRFVNIGVTINPPLRGGLMR